MSELASTDAYGINVLTDGRNTVAEVTIKFSPFSSLHVLGTGEARRHPRDKRDRELGELLALRRAFKDAGMNILREMEARGYDVTGL